MNTFSVTKVVVFLVFISVALSAQATCYKTKSGKLVCSPHFTQDKAALSEHELECPPSGCGFKLCCNGRCAYECADMPEEEVSVLDAESNAEQASSVHENEYEFSLIDRGENCPAGMHLCYTAWGRIPYCAEKCDN